jgi:uncharacterized repeat protein (TIGR01451 family)
VQSVRPAGQTETQAVPVGEDRALLPGTAPQRLEFGVWIRGATVPVAGDNLAEWLADNPAVLYFDDPHTTSELGANIVYTYTAVWVCERGIVGGGEEAKTTKTSDAATGFVRSGDQINFTITVTNTGHVDLVNITVVDELHEYLVFKSATRNEVALPATVHDNGTVTVEIPLLVAADADAGIAAGIATIVITTTVCEDATVGYTITNVAKVFNDEDEEIPASPGSEPGTEVEVTEERVSVVKTSNAPNGLVNAGAIVEYTITITNEGALKLENIEVIDELHARLVFQRASLNGEVQEAVYANGVVRIVVSQLLPETTAQVVIVTQVAPGTPGGTVIENIAEVRTEDGDLIGGGPDDEDASTTVTVRRPGTGSGVTPSPPTIILDPQVPLNPFVDDHIWYVQGFLDGSFRPDNSITRAEIATILFRLLDSAAKYGAQADRFDDVQAASWYA